MNGKENEILDRILDLLDMSSPEVLLRASKRRGVSAHVKIALEAFALEALERLDKRTKSREDMRSETIMRKRGMAGRRTEGYR